MKDVAIISGMGNPQLAAAVAAELGVVLTACAIDRFPDGELSVEIGEPVRGRTVFLIQPTGPLVNDRLMELLLLGDACRRAAAGRIIALVPYFGYARSDRRMGKRTPVSARAVAEVLTSAGIEHVVTLDVHAPQIEGFFRIPMDNLTAVPLLSAALRNRIGPDAVVVSPDLGAVRLAVEYGKRLGAPSAICHKERVSSSEVRVARIIGDVRGRPCAIIDDMITTGGTIAECARALREAGARAPLVVAATHGVLVDGAREKLAAAGVEHLFVTDSVASAEGTAPPTTVVSIAPLLARAVQHVLDGQSFGDLY
jgi:ribose-phosphate pyrophosphokinase